MQEKDRLKHDRIESANLASTFKTKSIKRKAIKVAKGLDKKKKKKLSKTRIFVSFARTLDIKRRIVLNIMHAMPRKVHYLL